MQYIVDVKEKIIIGLKHIPETDRTYYIKDVFYCNEQENKNRRHNMLLRPGFIITLSEKQQNNLLDKEAADLLIAVS